MFTISIKLNPGFSGLFMQHTRLLCLHLVVHSSVFPQEPTRGQDNTVEISEGGKALGGRGKCVRACGGAPLLC